MITRGRVPHVRRVCVLAWGGAAVSWELSSPGPLGPSLASCAAFLLLATGCALHIRTRLLAELRRSQEIAGAVQRALLRPLPARIDGLALAAAQLSVGGDLYEALPTPYGVRVVIGDVRGHGPGALGVASAVLGSFREAAHDEATLGGVLRRMERALIRHAGSEPEEFVTVLLLQIAPDGTLLALNCGHPWPYVLRWLPVPEPCCAGVRGRAPHPPARLPGTLGGSPRPERVGLEPLGGETLPPLGVLPLPGPGDLAARPCGRLAPGEALFLHTDGVADARDRAGRFFPLAGAVTEAAAAAALTPARLVAGVHAALLRHTSGRLADDVALLVLRNDRFGPA
ncbi:PP2C family protein-serine/threonine phosphatase [Streptomyces sp. NPDC051555]|uniref:PP2C family protein-serine/threonine phosphatase n=1 Tax=Streptomyces sp. NPDC051555 TaxID=3365657 RepID=UPI00378B4152